MPFELLSIALFSSGTPLWLLHSKLKNLELLLRMSVQHPDYSYIVSTEEHWVPHSNSAVGEYVPFPGKGNEDHEGSGT